MATPGQKLFLDPRQGTNNACGLIIYGPDNLEIGSCGFPQILVPPFFEFTPTLTAPYTVGVYANVSGAAVPYMFRMVTPNVTTMAGSPSPVRLAKGSSTMVWAPGATCP